MLVSEIFTERLTTNLNEGIIRSWLESFLPGFFAFLWCVILALIVWFIGTRISAMIRKGFKKSMTRHNAEDGAVQFLDAVIKIICYIVLVVIVLNLFGITTTSIAAAVASLGLTAGLALQGSLSNFAGGVLILLLHPFRVGDYIIEDTNKNEGSVEEISIFYTKLRTIDGRQVVIPNGTLANSSLTNVTTTGERQMDLTISISYDDDIREAKDIIEKLILAEDRRNIEKDYKIFVRELGHSSIDIGVRFFVPTPDYWPVRWKMLEDVKYAFDEAGITIPYQQIDIHTDGLEKIFKK